MVPGPGIGIKLLDAFHQAGPQGVEVDVADQLKQVKVFLADDGLVTVLEKMAGSLMAKVEDHRIAGQKPQHEDGKPCLPWAEQQVKMIVHECPGQAVGAGFEQEFSKAIEKQVAIIVVKEDVAPLDASDDDML